LWRAADAFHPESSPEAEKWVEDRLLALLSGRPAGEIAKSLRAMVARHDAKVAKPVVKCASYLVKNARWLHYDHALADGLPIATGVIEGACRYLVQDRMGRTGARWSLAGAEAVLRLRVLRTSGDFDDYWQFHVAKEHERTHASRYADGAVRQVIGIAPVERARKEPHLLKMGRCNCRRRGDPLVAQHARTRVELPGHHRQPSRAPQQARLLRQEVLKSGQLSSGLEGTLCGGQ
jgi:hypothetical protein